MTALAQPNMSTLLCSRHRLLQPKQSLCSFIPASCTAAFMAILSHLVSVVIFSRPLVIRLSELRSSELDFLSLTRQTFCGLSHAVHFYCSGTVAKAQWPAPHQVVCLIRGCGVCISDGAQTHPNEQYFVCNHR